ncbi:MAG: serine/threonine-protein kinase [Microbacteriaceae bacterium]
MVRRLPSQPPILPGFSHVHVLGSGGFADVFLYEQNMPRRQVAVKVMLSEVVNDHVRRMFQAEANLMAQLSAHPSILTVYQASVSSDGRPYLVMELCSSSLSQRYRSQRLPVAEVLRIAIKIGSAVETAHRAGVLHRDIKPSNILMTAYGHPVLSDFGIAATLGESAEQQAVGMSIPWSAPEVLMDETSGTVESEVWAFAATVYSLLAGRSPFEVPGQSNTSSDLVGRINRAKSEPIGRSDVPSSLGRLLTRAMSRKPENRPGSILEVLHELQAVETEIGVAQTPVEVAMDDWALATVADLEDRTRVRGVQNATTVAPVARRRRRVPAGVIAEHDAADTAIRPSVSRSFASQIKPRNRATQILAWTLVAVSALVIALGVTATLVLIRSTSTGIPAVSDISADLSANTVQFSWNDPGLHENDAYQITVVGGSLSVQSQPAFLVDTSPGERVCITVRVIRDGQLGEVSNAKCVEVPR